MAEVVEELITRITIDTAQALKNAQEIRANIDAMKVKLRELAETSKLSFKDLGAGMIASIKGMGFAELKTIFPQLTSDTKSVAQAQQTLTSAVRTATTELTKENKELKDNATATNQAGSATKSFGDIIKIAFGIGLGQIAVQALRNVIQLLQEATKSAFDFAKATFMLATGTNALRRAGVDITLKDIYINLDKLQKKFGVFSKKELVEGASAFMNLVRDMGFTREEIFRLQDAVATLAIVNGRAMDDVQRTVALALSSGYTEGLQRLGVSINRVNIALKAEELGYGRVYLALNEQQRATATRILLEEKTAKYAEDAAKYQNQLAGQIDTTSAAITDMKVSLGSELLPVQRMWNEVVLSTLTVLGALLAILSPVINLLSNLWHMMEESEKPGQTAADAIDKVTDANERLKKSAEEPQKFGTIFGGLDVEKYKAQTRKFMSAVLTFENDLNKVLFNENLILTENQRKFWQDMVGGQEELRKIFMPPKPLEEAPVGESAFSAAQEASERQMDIMADLAKQMFDLEQETDADRLEAKQKFEDDLTKISEDAWKKRLDIFDDYNKKIRDIDYQAQQDTKSAKDKYGLDVVQLNRQTNIKREEAEAKYRERQIKAEIDYQEKLQKLREGFLLDLDEALHERDARQILRLIKQYNLQKTQAAREQNIALDEMKRAHALELEEMENARQERLRVLQEELNARILAIQTEAAYKREQARIDRETKLAKLAQEVIDETAARKAKHDQELIDIATQADEKAKAIVKGLVDQYDLTAPELAAIAGLWESIYGPGGRIPNALKYTADYLARVNAMLAGLETGINRANTQNYQTHFGGGKPRASGGVDYATKPTSLTFGEAGPEMAITMPLSRGFSGNQYLNGNPISSLSGGSKNGSIDIALLLSPDLEARIVRKSGDTVANVLLEVQRQR